jgi:hypothetical protein
MKRILTYCGHLCIATLVVPFLALIALGVARLFITSAYTPQEFYSEHAISLAAAAGGLFSYYTSGFFTSRSALWVWVPVSAVFLFRVLDWHTSGSVLLGRGSVVEHFFTTNCQIQNWRDEAFDIRCPDRLFLTPLVIGTVAYSVGAAIRRAIPEGPTRSIDDIPGSRRVVTTRFGAVVALVLAGSFLGNRFHAAFVPIHPYSWKLLNFGHLPGWLVAGINVVFWSGIYALGIGFVRADLRKDEKALLVSFGGSLMLIPIAALIRRISGLVQITQTMLSLTSFLAAVSILLSLLYQRPELVPPTDG